MNLTPSRPLLFLVFFVIAEALGWRVKGRKMRDVVWGVGGSQLTTDWLVTKRERCSQKGQESVKLIKTK